MKNSLQRFNSFQQLNSYLKQGNEGTLVRGDGRKNDQVRTPSFTVGYLKYAEGSVLTEVGDNKIVCSASIEEKVPPFLRGGGRGWVTAEYAMLPRATSTRNMRDAVRGRLGGRTQEIQRLIGRALRAVVNLEALGERTILLDCDVIQADGGTRTHAINGAFIAMCEAVWNAASKGSQFRGRLVKDYLAAVSVGVVNGMELLDLNFEEDSIAQLDLNVVMSGKGKFVELQGTAELDPFSRETLDHLLTLAERGVQDVIKAQQKVMERGLP